MAWMIDADVASKRFRGWLEGPHEATEYNAGFDDAIYRVLDVIEHMPTLTQPNEWVSVEERVPEDSECWRTYIVTVNRSHWPTSSYDICDAPYDEQLVASAQYDSKQKIWHLPWDEQLNALIQADDAPLNGDFVTHWMPLPALPDSRPPEGEA